MAQKEDESSGCTEVFDSCPVPDPAPAVPDTIASSDSTPIKNNIFYERMNLLSPPPFQIFSRGEASKEKDDKGENSKIPGK